MAHESDKVNLLVHPSKSQRTAILDFHNQNFPNSKWNEHSFIKYFSEIPHHPICIAIRNEKAFDGIIIGRFSTNSQTSLNLATLLVSQRCRGRGYGEILMKEFFKSAANMPLLKKIYLHFRDSNSQIENFYQRFGFKKHRIYGKYSNGEKKHYMEISRKSIQEYLRNTNPCQK